MLSQKPIAEACLRNQQPIASALSTYLDVPGRVLEVGSGTGQHAVFIAAQLPHLQWQPTDLADTLPGIELWRQDAGLDNVLPAMELNVNHLPWTLAAEAFDAVFTANTVHFVDWTTVENLFRGTTQALVKGGHLLVYGPFNENGQHTSRGNQQLDQWLKRRAPESGIKDRQAVIELAADYGLIHRESHSLPANNQLLSFVKA